VAIHLREKSRSKGLRSSAELKFHAVEQGSTGKLGHSSPLEADGHPRRSRFGGYSGGFGTPARRLAPEHLLTGGVGAAGGGAPGVMEQPRRENSLGRPGQQAAQRERMEKSRRRGSRRAIQGRGRRKGRRPDQSQGKHDRYRINGVANKPRLTD